MNYKLIIGIVFLMLVSCGPQNNSACVIYDDFYVGIQQVSQDKWDDALNDEFKPSWDDWDCSYEIHFIINKGKANTKFFNHTFYQLQLLISLNIHHISYQLQ